MYQILKKNWDRTKFAYDVISQGKANYRSSDPFIAIDMAYARNETDEFISPTAITKSSEAPIIIEDEDIVIFANYRADRARQLARAFTKPSFKAFHRERMPKLSSFISLTSYKVEYEFPVAFLPVSLVIEARHSILRMMPFNDLLMSKTRHYYINNLVFL